MIQKNVTLYLGTFTSVNVVNVSQFDTMWQFVFSIYYNNQPWQIPAGASAVLNGRKPDGNVFAFGGTIADNKVAVNCDVQMTAVAGPVLCELSILSGGKVVGTANFIMDVEAAPKSPDDVSSDSTLPAYAEMLEMFSGDITNAVDAWLDSHASRIGGWSNKAKQALLTLLENVAYSNDQGRVYWDELSLALYPPADLVSISAVFNQGSATIYDTDTLDTLKQYLTVTAAYSDGTTEVVNDYTLSGTLTVGTSTITIEYGEYGGKSTTFDVVVTHESNGLVNGTYTAIDSAYYYDVSNNALTCHISSFSSKKYVRIPFRIPIELHTGDVVKFNAIRDGAEQATLSVDIGFNGSVFSDGGAFCPYRTTVLTKTVTLSEDVTATDLTVGIGVNARSFTLVLTVNGEDVFV